MCDLSPRWKPPPDRWARGFRSGSAWRLAARLDGSPSRTYVMLGDGEIQEGQIWEAAMFGAFHKVDNLVAIVDYNRIQLDGFVKDIMDRRTAGRQMAGIRMAHHRDRRARHSRDCKAHSPRPRRPKANPPR